MSLTLEREDESTLESFVRRSTPERGALEDWVLAHGLTLDDLKSEAAVLRMLLRAGADVVREQALDRGYAAYAAASGETEDIESREARRRYASRAERYA